MTVINFRRKKPLQDAVVLDVEASHLKHERLLPLVVSCYTRYLQVDVPNRSG
jgi:hypothetical protein